MKYLAISLALLGAATMGAAAQDAIPDLKGAWTGKGKAIAFGPSAEVFARVRNANAKGVPGAPQSPPQAKAEQRPSLAESVPS